MHLNFKPEKRPAPALEGPLDRDAPVYLAGHSGMLGTALLRLLRERGFTRIITRTSKELDLTDGNAVKEFFSRERPAYVILAAAVVGGIVANINRPAEFIHVNLAIQDNVIHASHLNNVRKLIFFGSSCMYPRDTGQPIREDSLLEGPPEMTSLPYAAAKIAGMVQCSAYRAQYGLNAVLAVPASLYGPGDNYDPENSHVLSGLLRKIHEARVSGSQTVEVWGDGTPTREFLYVDDAAEAVLYLMDHYSGEEWINLGSGQEISIRDLALNICDVVGYSGEIVFDTARPNGAPRKVLDNAKITGLGWKPRVGLREGLEKTYQWFLNNYKTT
ncbi:MAG: GDP-L-fucose synthase family protein [Desulfocucumaceae bacterium]